MLTFTNVALPKTNWLPVVGLEAAQERKEKMGLPELAPPKLDDLSEPRYLGCYRVGDHVIGNGLVFGATPSGRGRASCARFSARGIRS